MYKTILIGGINRSGGSLLHRLFDGHSNVGAYPMEFSFPRDDTFYPITESYTGIPLTVPQLRGDESIDELLNLLRVPTEKESIVTSWGKEQSDSVGVRKNYLEKAYYDNHKTDFNFLQFRHEIQQGINKTMGVAELYDVRHRAFFRAWDGGKISASVEHVVLHDSAGLYTTNLEMFYREFPKSVFIYPIRDVFGYVASEKSRLARRYFGSRRFAWPSFPNLLVKLFDQYDLEAQIRSWLISITRGVLLSRLSVSAGRFVVCRYENLVSDTEKTMRALCAATGLAFEDILIKPTIGGLPWSGNSHQGKQSGVSEKLASYYPKVLRDNEIEKIEKMAGKVAHFLKQLDQTPCDLSNIPEDILYDYKYQKKYIDDAEKTALYAALTNASRRRVMIKPPRIIALLAFLYAKYVRLLHVPRMIKLKWFPGAGKQNYT